MTEIVSPIIHGNGTSKAALMKLRDDFYVSLNTARDLLCRLAPNGRDYYPDPGRMEKAQEQHWRRMNILAALIEEIEQELELMDSQTEDI